MTKLEAALVDVTSFLDDGRIPYMVIGGFANLFWGVERFTRDLDITIEVSDAALEELVSNLAELFSSRARDDCRAQAAYPGRDAGVLGTLRGATGVRGAAGGGQIAFAGGGS